MKDVKELVTGVLLGKFSCPECLSQDNLLVYTKTDNDGVSYLDGSCRTPSCKSFWTEQELKVAGVLDENFVAPKTKPVVKTAITKAEYKNTQLILVLFNFFKNIIFKKFCYSNSKSFTNMK